jgi:cell division protein FtsB
VARTKSQLVRQVVVLALVFFAVAFAVAVPLRNYLSQRAELAATVSQEQQLRAQLAGLEAQQQALSDPAFIMSQAMRRLQYVKPGSTVYVVNAPPLAAAKPAGAAASELTTPWYSQLWSTLADPVAPGKPGTGSTAAGPSSSVAPKAGR